MQNYGKITVSMAKIKIKKSFRNLLIALAVVIVLSVVLRLLPDKTFKDKYDGYDLTSLAGAASSSKTYAEYLREHEGAAEPALAVAVAVQDYDEAKSYGVSVETNYRGKAAVVTADESSVTWSVDVGQPGFYNIEMEYIAVPSRNVNMERILYINGEVPFSGSDMSFYRLWKDGGPVRQDNRGNSIRPTQEELFSYQTVMFKSNMGYEVEPYKFYFAKGTNTITLESTNEPMAISRLSLVPVASYDSYEQYVAKQKSRPEDFSASGISVKVQGENSVVRSDPSLFARYDRSSANTEPNSVSRTVLNYSGGDSWRSPGQWIEWDMEVPEDGWYTLSVKARQLYQRGYVAYRSVYIDGVIPVDGLKSVGFPYSSDWKLSTLAGKDGKPYSFYLTKGSHRVRLEVTLGELGSIVSDLQDCIYRLNVIYRKILVLTGVNPDQFRDYAIDKVYPEQVEAMLQESRRLYYYVDKFVAITGEKSDKIAPAETLAIQLEQFYKHPDRITKAFANFKENITSLGTSLLSISESKLDVDYLLLQSAADKVKPVKSGFFRNAAHEFAAFISSFFVDSASIGNVYGKDAEHLIEVWIVTGRDQSQILKNMVDDSFSPASGINVNVKLININSLLTAVVAGNGPDVVVSAYSRAPVDYALRNAVVDLRRFSDCDKVLGDFHPSAYEGYKYDGGLFALPEQETFNLLFYRKDILEQLGVSVPRTWDELVEILPTLQGNNLSVGIPYPTLLTAESDIMNFYSMIYQRGGTVYNEAGTKSVIDSEEGIASFKLYTSFYNSYGLPTVFDFVSRFRTGEMPLGIQNYTAYNTLSVSAPEIRGLWDFTYIPGTPRRDGSIDRSNIAGTVCTMMIQKGPELSKLPANADAATLAAARKNEVRMSDAWEFMKWWASTDTQVRYGREQEAILGSSGRYATANVEALKQLSWNSRQIGILTKSLNEAVGLPEVPGSYYTPRYVVNGIRRVFNEKDDPRETLIDYTRKVNEEISRKRQEFKLPLEQE